MRISFCQRIRSLPRRQYGFSLIELIAAFVIFALGFGILLQILAGSIRTTQRSAEYTQAALWAQSKLDPMGVGEKLKEGDSNGQFDTDYRWDLHINKYQPPNTNLQLSPDSPAPIDLYELDLTVSWGGRYQTHNARFVTLRASNPDLGLSGAPSGAKNSFLRRSLPPPGKGQQP